MQSLVQVMLVSIKLQNFHPFKILTVKKYQVEITFLSESYTGDAAHRHNTFTITNSLLQIN
jgi:hypothetical protein